MYRLLFIVAMALVLTAPCASAKQLKRADGSGGGNVAAKWNVSQGAAARQTKGGNGATGQSSVSHSGTGATGGRR